MASTNKEKYELLPELDVPPEKPKRKPELKDLIDDFRAVKPWRRIKPLFINGIYLFVAFVAGSIVNYLVSYNYIKPQQVTQIIVFMLTYLFLWLRYKLGDKKGR